MPVSKGQQNRRLLVALVLDKSTSMNTIAKETIENTNKQFEELRKSDDAVNTYVAFFTFDTLANSVFKDENGNPKLVPCSELKDISELDYHPHGYTAMYDGVGDAITYLAMEAKSWDDVLVVIISDGDENMSKRFTSERIASMVKEMTDSGWTFTYIGANQDLTKVKETLGFNAGNILSYSATSKGVADMSSTHTSAIRSYTSTRSSLRASGVSGRISATNMYSAPSDDQDNIKLVLSAEEQAALLIKGTDSQD